MLLVECLRKGCPSLLWWRARVKPEAAARNQVCTVHTLAWLTASAVSSCLLDFKNL